MNRRTPSPFEWMRGFLNLWVIGGAVVVALLLLGAVIVILLTTRPGPKPVGASTAVLNVIPAPTATPPPPTATTPPNATPSQAVPPSPPPGEIGIGAYVQITGTGGDGLRLRIDPGLKGETRILGGEAEVFEVRDGPQELDGYTWWYLVGPADPSRRGWAVANYLSPIQKP